MTVCTDSKQKSRLKIDKTKFEISKENFNIDRVNQFKNFRVYRQLEFQILHNEVYAGIMKN